VPKERLARPVTLSDGELSHGVKPYPVERDKLDFEFSLPRVVVGVYPEPFSGFTPSCCRGLRRTFFGACPELLSGPAQAVFRGLPLLFFIVPKERLARPVTVSDGEPQHGVKPYPVKRDKLDFEFSLPRTFFGVYPELLSGFTPNLLRGLPRLSFIVPKGGLSAKGASPPRCLAGISLPPRRWRTSRLRTLLRVPKERLARPVTLSDGEPPHGVKPYPVKRDKLDFEFSLPRTFFGVYPELLSGPAPNLLRGLPRTFFGACPEPFSGLAPSCCRGLPRTFFGACPDYFSLCRRRDSNSHTGLSRTGF
jgi:hypothetical protein